MPFAPLNTTWFALIGLLWAGYLFLEGFDFGVSMVGPLVSRDETDRRICLNSIGPFWDGNEVWLLVAGGATFAAFPSWYAHLFSGFYLVLFLVLVALIVRGVSFEFRNKVDDARWRAAWSVANFVGSLVPAIVWGAAFTDFAHGVPLGPSGYTGGLLGAVHPIALLGGATSLSLFCMQGSLFLSLKTGEDLAARARRAARRCGVASTLLLAALVTWLAAAGRPAVPGQLPGWAPLAVALVALGAVGGATALAVSGRDGLAFASTGVGVVAAVGAAFARMFPAVIPASNASAKGGLLIGEAASLHNTLMVMTVVAAIFTPVVLAYQGWTYWVFRQRLTRPPVAADPARREGTGGAADARGSRGGRVDGGIREDAGASTAGTGETGGHGVAASGPAAGPAVTPGASGR
ncbi:MAG TPA: cytochrome d ubiquinol oxidase subunit II [Acidimicrobiales bacterium]|nr:cytochrome d ubiquinol oxidase subunit II [Acidimicrobiales bacterium]